MALSVFMFLACEKEDEKKSGDPYFTIEGILQDCQLELAAKTQSYVVRSNRPWQIVAKTEADMGQGLSH
jgi:hypothetical protein